MIFHEEGLRHLIAEVGVDHMVYGTDYPFDWPFGIDFVALRLSSTYGPGKQERHGAVGIPSMVVENAYYGRPHAASLS